VAVGERDYSETVVKTLFALSGNTCAFSRCEEKLTDPSWAQVNAQISHICGFKPTSPRYDACMTDEQRNGFDNLILLCPNHHRKVDYLIPEDYPVDVLQKMKADHDNADWGATEADLSRFAQLLLTELVTDVPPPVDAQAPGARQRTVTAMPTRTTSTSPPTSITPARRRD
jgi:hypothetical protein